MCARRPAGTAYAPGRPPCALVHSRAPRGRQAERVSELARLGPPLAPAGGLGGAGAGLRCPRPPVPSPGSSGGTEQRGLNGREHGEARRSSDNGSGIGEGRGAPGLAGTGGRAMSSAAGRPAAPRAGRGERPLRALGRALRLAMICRG